MRRTLRFLVLSGAVGLAATGCSPGSSVAKAVVTHAYGVPVGVSTPPQAALDLNSVAASWATADEIYVVTWGSGSCPKLPTSVRAAGPQQVVIKTKEHLGKGGNSCTADLAPTSSTVRLPSTATSTSALTVTIDGTAIVLPPRK